MHTTLTKVRENVQCWGSSEMKFKMAQLFKRTAGQYILNVFMSYDPALTPKISSRIKYTDKATHKCL